MLRDFKDAYLERERLLLITNFHFIKSQKFSTYSNTALGTLTLNLPTTTIVAQPFNVIKWQLKFNPVA